MNSYLSFALILSTNLIIFDINAIANTQENIPHNLESQVFYANSLNNKQTGSSGKKLAELFNPPGDGAPEDTNVGGTRNTNSCSSNEPNIVALMPAENYALTFQESPQIYLSIPATSAQEVLISLQDEMGEIYETNYAAIQVMGNSKIANFSLPATAIPLKTNKRYQWFVTVICKDYVQPSDPTFSGWIKKVEPKVDMTLELSSKSLDEQLEWYAQNSYWYDMLDAIPVDSSLWKEIVTEVQ